MVLKLRVRKKSGKLERFQPKKIERSILRAGSTAGAALSLALNVAKEVVEEVVEDVISHAEKGVVSSRVIRRHVIRSLKKRHPKIAHAYVKHKKKSPLKQVK